MWIDLVRLALPDRHGLSLHTTYSAASVIRQGNNAYIFPGIGLAAVACGATRITDLDMYIAAKALAETVPKVPTSVDISECSLRALNQTIIGGAKMHTGTSCRRCVGKVYR